VARAASAALAFAAVGWTALANGGFFATAWGWPALGFLVLLLAAVIAGDRAALGPLDVIALGALAAFAGWTALSSFWSPGIGLPLDDAELLVVYVAGLACFLVFTGRESARWPAIGAACAIVPVAAYALATRLLPDHVGRYDPAAGYLLGGTVGYWNALGLLVALASLIALGAIAYEPDVRVRAAAAASLVVLVPTLYFTFSRGAAAALALGIVVALALDPGRVRLTLVLFVALPLALVGAWLCSRSAPLTKAGFPRSAAAHDGHRVAIALIVLGLLNALVVIGLSVLERRVSISSRARRTYVRALALAVAAVLAVGLVRVGDPVKFVGHATDAFRTDAPTTGGNLNRRFTTLSSHGRSDYWSVAWREVGQHPLLGGGAASFRRYWLRYRPAPLGALNAHNLYLETLAEVGPVGLLFLLVALVTPLAAAVRARRRRFVPVAAGGYVAFLAHAAIDWDWQLPAVTLAALACASVCLAAARPERTGVALRASVRIAAAAAAVGLVTFVFAMQLGHNALAASDRAANDDRHPAAAADARAARRWLPWSAEPRRRLGEEELAAGNAEAARHSLREALDRDSSDWATWFDLALATGGSERARALAQASRLNPESPEIQALRG